MAKNILNASALNNEVKTEVKTPTINDGVHFVVISFASNTTDKDVGVVRGTEYDEYCNDSEFECNVALDTKIPPVTKTSLERLQGDGYFLTYPAPILGRTGYDVTVTNGLVTKVQRVWTDEEKAKLNAERKQNVLKDYASRFVKGGKQ